jgi:SOS response regulatory protein OraA/RecX
MSKKIADLAKQLDITSKKLKEEIKKLGFEVKTNARTIDDETATMVMDELRDVRTKNNEKDTVQIYEELYDKELDREIIKKAKKTNCRQNIK